VTERVNWQTDVARHIAAHAGNVPSMRQYFLQ